jgi:hypothetical protein
MNSGEVRKRSEGQKRIALAKAGGHAGEDDAEAGYSCDQREWNERAPVAPMKEMPIPQGTFCADIKSFVRVEQSIPNVDNPGPQREQHRRPKRQANPRCPRKAQRPNNGNGGSIKTAQVPEAE